MNDISCSVVANLTALTALVLLAQGPVCGGLYGTTPESSPIVGCFVPSGRGDGSGAQIFVDPLGPNGYRAKPIPPRQWGLDPINNY
jgi:hypothetical protein